MASSTTFLALRSPDCNSTPPGMTYAPGRIRLWSSRGGRGEHRFHPAEKFHDIKSGIREPYSHRKVVVIVPASLHLLCPPSSINIGAKRRLMITQRDKSFNAWPCVDFYEFFERFFFSSFREEEEEEKIGRARSRVVEVDWLLSKL